MHSPFASNFSLFSSIRPSRDNTITFDDECDNLEDYQPLVDCKGNKYNEKDQKKIPFLQIDNSFNQLLISAKVSPNCSIILSKPPLETVKESPINSNKTRLYLEVCYLYYFFLIF